MAKKNRTNNFFNNELPEEYDFQSVLGFIQRHQNRSTNDLDARLHDQPHYTEDYYKTPRVIFGKEQNTDSNAYSDRIWQWNYEKSQKSSEIATNSGATLHTARWYQNYLSAYFDRNVEIVYIMAGFNLSNGYPYQFFAWNWKD